MVFHSTPTSTLPMVFHSTPTSTLPKYLCVKVRRTKEGMTRLKTRRSQWATNTACSRFIKLTRPVRFYSPSSIDFFRLSWACGLAQFRRRFAQSRVWTGGTSTWLVDRSTCRPRCAVPRDFPSSFLSNSAQTSITTCSCLLVRAGKLSGPVKTFWSRVADHAPFAPRPTDVSVSGEWLKLSTLERRLVFDLPLSLLSVTQVVTILWTQSTVDRAA